MVQLHQSRGRRLGRRQRVNDTSVRDHTPSVMKSVLSRGSGSGWALTLRVIVFLLACGAASAQSQNKSDPQKTLDEDEVIRVRANLVNVDVMVKDRKGKYV